MWDFLIFVSSFFFTLCRLWFRQSELIFCSLILRSLSCPYVTTVGILILFQKPHNFFPRSKLGYTYFVCIDQRFPKYFLVCAMNWLQSIRLIFLLFILGFAPIVFLSFCLESHLARNQYGCEWKRRYKNDMLSSKFLTCSFNKINAKFSKKNFFFSYVHWKIKYLLYKFDENM